MPTFIRRPRAPFGLLLLPSTLIITVVAFLLPPPPRQIFYVPDEARAPDDRPQGSSQLYGNPNESELIVYYVR